MKMRPQCDSASEGIPGTTEDSATRQRIGASVFVGSSLFEWPLHTGLLQGLPGDRFLRGGSPVDHPFGIVQPPFRAETRMIPVSIPKSRWGRAAHWLQNHGGGAIGWGLRSAVCEDAFPQVQRRHSECKFPKPLPHSSLAPPRVMLILYLFCRWA